MPCPTHHMPLALYYKPSFERLQERITALAPALDVAVFDESGHIFFRGEQIQIDDIAPEYFWFHAELMRSPQLQQYFKWMLASNSIKWLHTINTGLDHLPYKALLNKGVLLTNNHGQAIAIAEFVLGHVLAYYQDHASLRRQQQDKLWKMRAWREIAGTHWLVVGFGHIGQELARRLKTFGATVTAVRRQQDTAGLADHVVPPAALQAALPHADVVVLACTSTAETRNLVDAPFLAAMKPGSVLVNVARGDLVVDSALQAALDAGTPAHAILDVFNEEPLPASSWYWEHPRVTLTPHTSNAGSGMRSRSEAVFLENLTRIMAQQPLLNQVASKDIV